MPRRLLDRAIFSQIASYSKAKDITLHEAKVVRQSVYGAQRNDVPDWALPYSTRRQFSSASATRKEDDNPAILRTASITLDELAEKDFHEPDDSSFQILLEWRAMRSRLQVLPPEKPATLPPAASLSPTFFDSNKALSRDQDAIPAKDTTASIRTRHAPLWISQLDYELLSKITQICMRDIRMGDRDIKKLAVKFLAQLDDQHTSLPSREIRLEQIELYILAQWIARVDNALGDKARMSNLTGVCLDISSRLFRSMAIRDASPTSAQAAEYANLRSVQQATLHRLFETAYSFSGFMIPSKHPLAKQALLLMNDVLHDTRLRPAQARHLARKYLERLNCFTNIQPTYKDNGRLWLSTTDTVMHLIKTGAVTVLPSSTSSKEPVLDLFIRLLCLARSKRHISRLRAHDTLTSVICKSQEVAAEALLQYRNQNFEKVFTGLAFVNTSTLENITTLLHQSGDRSLLREIVFMAPQEQRTLSILTTLMRNWSNVAPSSTLSTGKSSTGSVDGGVLKDRRCITSEKMWAEAVPMLDQRDPLYESKVCEIFGARMASHARSKAPSLVVADLDYLQRSLEGDFKRQDVMAMLPEKAQIDAIRAFLRAGLLIKATRMANEIASQKINDDFKVKLMNVLFSGDLRLRMRSDVVISRRRFAILLRKRAIYRAQRLHLRHVINRYFRSMKQATLKTSTTSGKKRVCRFIQSLQSLHRFATRHSINPNEQTTKIIVNALDRLGKHIKHQGSTLLRGGSIDWHTQSTSEVLKQIRMFLLPGGQQIAARTHDDLPYLG